MYALCQESILNIPIPICIDGMLFFMNKYAQWQIEERQSRHLSQSDLARLGNISQSHISRVESGNRPPGKDYLNAIAKVFDVPIEIVYRKAGFLPDETELDEISKKILHVSNKLTDNRREELFRYAELQLQMQNERGEFNPNGHPETSQQAP